MTETQFQKKVIDYLTERGCVVVNYNPGATGKGGMADLIVCMNGFFVAIELKVKHELQLRQAMQLNRINNARGVGIVLYEGLNWERQLDDLIVETEMISDNFPRHLHYYSHVDLDVFIEDKLAKE